MAEEKKTTKKATTAKKTVAKKAPTKKAATKTTAAKKTTAKATTAKKPAAKKPAVKKTTTAKATTAKKAPAKKVASKTTAAKSTAKKTATTKKPTVKKAAPKKSAVKKKVTFRIHRGEKMQGKFQSRIEEFAVDYDDSTTVLQALEDIKGDQDGTLTFRRSCRASICGSCGMFINNRSRLACKTKVKDIVNGMPDKAVPPSDIVEVAPQKNQPVLRDLAVDISKFYKKVEQIHPFVQEGPEAATEVDKTSFEQVNMVSNCIMCGCCYSDCTMMVENPNFIGPAALAKAFRFVADPREGHKTDRLEELSENNGIWDCTRCGMCIDACPKDVAPMEAIGKLRTRALDAGITDNAGAKHAMAFKGDLAHTGVLDETLMVLKTLGFTGALAQTGNALNLLKKGKVPMPFMTEKVEGVEEIQAIYDILEENPIEVETKQEDTGPGAG